MQHVRPYSSSGEGKKDQVRRMFDNIAGSYDLLNRVLSAGMDAQWRRKAVALLGDMAGKEVLDVATGTGDVAFEIARRNPEARIAGLDIASNMLELARKKSTARGFEERISFTLADSENIPFANNSYDAVTVAFGVRNFENLEKGLAEMYRVLKPGGKVVILEFTRPRSFPFKQVFGLYFKHILPRIGGLKSGDRKAYRYLFESVQAFPDYERFLDKLNTVGYRNGSFDTLTLGICAIYQAEK